MGAIDLQTAQKMVDLYTVTRRTLINQTYGINDTKGIWFSIDQVNSFISSLTPDITGVRIYMGVYPETDPTYPNQTTVIAIGTVTNATGINVDPIGQNTPMLNLTGGGGQNPYNHGTLCPPETNC